MDTEVFDAKEALAESLYRLQTNSLINCCYGSHLLIESQTKGLKHSSLRLAYLSTQAEFLSLFYSFILFFYFYSFNASQ